MARRSCLALLASALLGACSVPPLSPEGKRCSPSDACPAPFSCVAEIGGGTCHRVTAFQDGVAPDSGYFGTRDTILTENSPSLNLGTAAWLDSDSDEPDNSWLKVSSLLRFDLSALSPATEVLDAWLVLFVVDVSDGQTQQLFAAPSSWVETEATWQVPATGQAWPGAGGTFGTAPLGPAVGELASTQLRSYTVQLNGEGRTLVQRWVSDPSTNHGLVLAGTNWNGQQVSAREAVNAADRPRVVVVH